MQSMELLPLEHICFESLAHEVEHALDIYFSVLFSLGDLAVCEGDLSFFLGDLFFDWEGLCAVVELVQGSTEELNPISHDNLSGHPQHKG